MADATVEAYTEVVDEAVDVNVAVAAAEEGVPHLTLDFVLDRSWPLDSDLRLLDWHLANFSRPISQVIDDSAHNHRRIETNVEIPLVLENAISLRDGETSLLDQHDFSRF